MLKKYFLNLYSDISYDAHYCCSKCHSPLNSRSTPCCYGCDPAQFLIVSVEAQLKRKLQGRFLFDYCIQLSLSHIVKTDPTLWSHLQKRFQKEEKDIFQDVSDGFEYLRHKCFLSEPAHVLNMDGVNLFHSCSISLWPIWLAITELPARIRYIRICACTCICNVQKAH